VSPTSIRTSSSPATACVARASVWRRSGANCCSCRDGAIWRSRGGWSTSIDGTAASALSAWPELEARLQDATLAYQNLSAVHRHFPAVVEKRAALESLRAEVAAERNRVVSGIAVGSRREPARPGSLEQAIDQREEQLMTLNERSVQYNILRREYETNRELYDALLQRMKEIGVAAGVQKSNISVIDDARVPGAAFRPVLTKNLAIASMLGLMIGVGLALLLEFLDSTIRRTDDLERLVDRPVLGLIPLVRLRDQKGSGTRGRPDRVLSHYSTTHPKSAVSEAFRSLRTSLMFSTPGGMPKVLLFTSAPRARARARRPRTLRRCWPRAVPRCC
jgi:polysaccharide biosynthesis transport protein